MFQLLEPDWLEKLLCFNKVYVDNSGHMRKKCDMQCEMCEGSFKWCGSYEET
jgi:hypothetical protein